MLFLSVMIDIPMGQGPGLGVSNSDPFHPNPQEALGLALGARVELECMAAMGRRVVNGFSPPEYRATPTLLPILADRKIFREVNGYGNRCDSDQDKSGSIRGI